VSQIPDHLRYTAEHEWVAGPDADGTVTFGITDYAQDALGDIVYVSLPAEGDQLVAGAACGEIESTKSVSELYAPVSGTVTERNDRLEGTPELLNSDPYGDGWMVRVQVADAGASDGLLDAAREADVLVLTMPLTDASRGVIGREVLAALPPRAWLVNVSRGALVDEPALLEALRAGRLAGAVLDVFGEEPLPSDSPWWDAPNVIVTPHASGHTLRFFDELVVENVRRYLAGEPLLNPVDPERGY
jgi:glycine cleavage system H protein